MSSRKTTTAAEKTSSLLSERAMIAHLAIGYWEGRKKDKQVTNDVINENNAEKETGSWWTRLIPAADLTRIGSAVTKGRALHWKFTLPWGNDGDRILSAEAFLQYTADLRATQEEFFAAVDSFIEGYPALVDKAASRLAGLYKPEMFPTPEALRRKFTWKVQIRPLPEATDFRVNMGEEAAAEIRKSIESDNAEVMAEAMSDIWTRLHKAVKTIVDQLSKADGPLREALTNNAKDLCNLLPKLNITNDPNLEAMRKAVVETITPVDAKALRKNKTARADTAKAAADVLKKMEAFMGQAPKA